MAYPASGSYEDETHCPKGDGGNTTIRNQDEQMILNRTATTLPVRTEGMQDSEAH